MDGARLGRHADSERLQPKLAPLPSVGQAKELAARGTTRRLFRCWFAHGGRGRWSFDATSAEQERERDAGQGPHVSKDSRRLARFSGTFRRLRCPAGNDRVGRASLRCNFCRITIARLGLSGVYTRRRVYARIYRGNWLLLSVAAVLFGGACSPSGAPDSFAQRSGAMIWNGHQFVEVPATSAGTRSAAESVGILMEPRTEGLDRLPRSRSWTPERARSAPAKTCPRTRPSTVWFVRRGTSATTSS